MSNTLPLISVIVPVYNVENYLDTCVQSIVDQTYTNLEIILVDDGSPDNCGAMCDAWAEKDARIRVIHKENGGQADARNVGLEEANGELIGFVDSDDWIATTMYERLYTVLCEHEADIAECCMFQFDDEHPAQMPQEDEIVTTFETEAAVENLINDRYFTCTVPNMLVKADVAKAVLFDVGKTHEDILWPYRVFRKAARAVHISTRFYAYYQRQGSTMNSAYSEKRFDALDALQERARLVKTEFPSLYALAERTYIGACMYHYQTLCRAPSSKEYKVFQKRLHDRFLVGDRRVAFADISLKYKVWYTLFAAFPTFTCRVRNVLRIGL